MKELGAIHRKLGWILAVIIVLNFVFSWNETKTLMTMVSLLFALVMLVVALLAEGVQYWWFRHSRRCWSEAAFLEHFAQFGLPEDLLRELHAELVSASRRSSGFPVLPSDRLQLYNVTIIDMLHGRIWVIFGKHGWTMPSQAELQNVRTVEDLLSLVAERKGETQLTGKKPVERNSRLGQPNYQEQLTKNSIAL